MIGIRTELLSSYGVTASRVGAWAVVSGLAYRMATRQEFSDVAVARSTVTLLTCLSAGLGPVVLRRLVETLRDAHAFEAIDLARAESNASPGAALSYAPTVDPRYAPTAALYASAWSLFLTLGAAVAIAILLAALFLPGASGAVHSSLIVLVLMTAGMYARISGDVAGTLLQASGRLAIDNALISMGEWSWPAMLMVWQVMFRPPGSNIAQSAGAAFLVSGLVSTLFRLLAARVVLPMRREPGQRLLPVARSLLAPAGILILAHFADFLYAPANQILLQHLGRSDSPVADYVPALQIDGALLLLTAAVSTVILPRAARALAIGEVAAVRRLYLVGTASTLAILLLAAIPTALLARWILTTWLGPSVSAQAVFLVPLVLIHTVIGGSSGIGRAVLLAAGKYRTYALAALTAGIANVTLAFLVLRFTSMGPAGIVAVTIATVTARCALWMPWYTIRTLAQLTGPQLAPAPASTIIPPSSQPVGEV